MTGSLEYTSESLDLFLGDRVLIRCPGYLQTSGFRKIFLPVSVAETKKGPCPIIWEIFKLKARLPACGFCSTGLRQSSAICIFKKLLSWFLIWSQSWYPQTQDKNRLQISSLFCHLQMQSQYNQSRKSLIQKLFQSNTKQSRNSLLKCRPMLSINKGRKTTRCEYIKLYFEGLQLEIAETLAWVLGGGRW